MSTVTTENAVNTTVNYFDFSPKTRNAVTMFESNVIDNLGGFCNAEQRKAILSKYPENIALAKSLHKDLTRQALSLVEITVYALQYRRTAYCFIANTQNSEMKADAKFQAISPHSKLGGRWSKAWMDSACEIVGAPVAVKTRGRKKSEKTEIVETPKVETVAETAKTEKSGKAKKAKAKKVEVTVAKTEIVETPKVETPAIEVTAPAEVV